MVTKYIHKAINKALDAVVMTAVTTGAMLVAMVATAATAAAQTPVKQHHEINMGDFGELRVVDAINVDYFCNPDSAGYVVFDCEPEIAPLILMSNKSNILRLQTQSDVPIPRLPRVRVYSTWLVSAENSGDSTLVVNAPAPGATLKLRVIGNGTIIGKGLHANIVEGRIDTGRGKLFMEGVAKWIKLRTVGTGSIEAGTLKCDRADILIGGTGSVDCNVANELTVKGLGSGKVYVKGTPQVKNRTLGTVKVINVE